MSRVAAMALLAVLIEQIGTSLPAHAEAADGKKEVHSGMQRYVIPMKGCAVEFVAKVGGYARVTPSDQSWGAFAHEYYFPRRKDVSSLWFTLSCHSEDARDMCPRFMADRRETEPDMIRSTRMRTLHHLNPRYYTDAYIVTETTGPMPRPRWLVLCMGDESRTITTENGGIRLGYGPRQIIDRNGRTALGQSEYALPDVRAIIRSMRFLPDADVNPPPP